jgi:hypothetical protein
VDHSPVTSEYVLSEIRKGWIGQYDNGRWYRDGSVNVAPIYLRRIESLLMSGAARFSDRWLDDRAGRVRMLKA